MPRPSRSGHHVLSPAAADTACPPGRDGSETADQPTTSQLSHSLQKSCTPSVLRSESARVACRARLGAGLAEMVDRWPHRDVASDPPFCPGAAGPRLAEADRPASAADAATDPSVTLTMGRRGAVAGRGDSTFASWIGSHGTDGRVPLSCADEQGSPVRAAEHQRERHPVLRECDPLPDFTTLGHAHHGGSACMDPDRAFGVHRDAVRRQAPGEHPPPRQAAVGVDVECGEPGPRTTRK